MFDAKHPRAPDAPKEHLWDPDGYNHRLQTCRRHGGGQGRPFAKIRPKALFDAQGYPKPEFNSLSNKL